MTLHAQHLAYLPAARRHQRRMRALKDYQKLVDDLQAAESEWGQTPAAPRNRELLTMWQEQVSQHSFLTPSLRQLVQYNADLDLTTRYPK